MLLFYTWMDDLMNEMFLTDVDLYPPWCSALKSVGVTMRDHTVFYGRGMRDLLAYH
jgi:hypothetical protein